MQTAQREEVEVLEEEEHWGDTFAKVEQDGGATWVKLE